MRAEAPAWPPKARAVEHQHGQPLGGRIDGGGEAGRAGADDGDVIDAVRIEPADKADAAAERGLGRVAQDVAVRAEHHRQRFGVDMEARDDGARRLVLGRIERLVRHAVARQEVLQAQHVAMVGAADDDRAGAELRSGRRGAGSVPA